MLRYHTFNKRLFAHFVDGLVMMPLLLMEHFTANFNNMWLVAGGQAAYLLLWTAYLAISHARWGQTLGKRLVQIKVVDVQDENRLISYRKAFLRESIPFVIGVIALIIFIADARLTGETDPFLNDSIRHSQLFVSGWMLIELITMLFSAKRRAVHDFMASSVVIDLAEVRRNYFKEKQAQLLQSLQTSK